MNKEFKYPDGFFLFQVKLTAWLQNEKVQQWKYFQLLISILVVLGEDPVGLHRLGILSSYTLQVGQHWDQEPWSCNWQGHWKYSFL